MRDFGNRFGLRRVNTGPGNKKGSRGRITQVSESLAECLRYTNVYICILCTFIYVYM